MKCRVHRDLCNRPNGLVLQYHIKSFDSGLSYDPVHFLEAKWVTLTSLSHPSIGQCEKKTLGARCGAE